MKRPFSPLVWLCATGAIALGALTLYDPNGLYAGYVDALDRNTPIIAAVFTAAQDGVYPWSSRAEVDAPSRNPVYRPITESVTDEEMRSSVGNDEPFSEDTPAQPDELAVDSAPPASSDNPEEGADASGATVAPAGASVPAPQFSAGFVTVDQSWFDDALFIGDSHIEGFCDYGGVPNATYYFKRGLDIWSVLSKPFVGGKQTIPQALSKRQFGKIYIMLGINEIGCGTTESYAAQYADVVARLRELQPNALIYIQAIFHTSQKKSDSSIYNNDTINARNAAISTIADGQHVFFVDCNAVFDDENGTLTSTYSGDGVHVKAPYYTMWRDYLLRFGLSGVVTVEAETPTERAIAEPTESGTAAEVKPPVEKEPTPTETLPPTPNPEPDVSDAVSDAEPAAELTGVSDSIGGEDTPASAPDMPEPDMPSVIEPAE